MKKEQGSGQEKKGAREVGELRKIGPAEQEMRELLRGEELVNGQAVTFDLIDQARFMRDTKARLSKIKDITDLPFVKDTSTGKGKKKVTERSYWSVNPSGDYTKDCETGHKYAAAYHAYTQNNPGGSGVLQRIVFSMMESGDSEKDKGLIVGFFYFIDATLAPIDIPRRLFRGEIFRKWMQIGWKNQRKRKHFLPYEWKYEERAEETEPATA